MMTGARSKLKLKTELHVKGQFFLLLNEQDKLFKK